MDPIIRFDASQNSILSIDKQPAIGMNFGIKHLRAGEEYGGTSQLESAWVLLHGHVEVRKPYACTAHRVSLFADNPLVIHLPAHSPLSLIAKTRCEFATIETSNNHAFDPHIYTPDTLLETEQRGKGMLNDTAHRIVRTVFDGRNASHSNLVVGEVVNFPGRWSSYPPHHHPQPEIYHYRFDHPNGYGHGEVGDDVYKIRDKDTLVISGEKDHAQVAAPGYSMYYLWVIRQTPEQPYTKPTFAKEHAWLLEA